MFLFGRKNKEECVYSPVNGRVKPLTRVNDPVFSAGTMGSGFAVVPSDGAVCAPVSGEVSTVFPGGHAIGITTPGGAEVLIHIGIDTVKQKGDGFELMTSAGSRVSAGDKLVQADIQRLEKAGLECDVIVVVTSQHKCSLEENLYGTEVKTGETCIMHLRQ